MKFRPHHLQHIAAAKAGFSERTARRMETFRHSAPQPISNRTRHGPDPFDGLWDSEIRPMLEAHPLATGWAARGDATPSSRS